MNSLHHKSTLPDEIDMKVLFDIQKDIYDKLTQEGVVTSPEEGAYLMTFPSSMSTVLRGQLVMYTRKNPKTEALEHVVNYIPSEEQRVATQSSSFKKIVLEDAPHLFNIRDLKHSFLHCAYLLYMEQVQRAMQEIHNITSQELQKVLD